ncbi:hypothetical protein TNCT_58111 [Trichonephila clavata]|uniref:Uncharacterized protein n=1 Tax=Trichonephila clavata TaxID=2740835 RepID=A0A8X6GL86_TRICU|nr:hypothetical protein TNCT_58111 [Trichonephila clavata]
MATGGYEPCLKNGGSLVLDRLRWAWYRIEQFRLTAGDGVGRVDRGGWKGIWFLWQQRERPVSISLGEQHLAWKKVRLRANCSAPQLRRKRSK